MSDLMKVGSDWGGAGTFKPFTSGVSGAQRTSDAHGRFTDATLAGRVFMGGSTLVAINNATFTIATTGATATPIIGLWNPLVSGKYLSVLQAQLATIMTALQATGPGGYVWTVSSGNGAISTGSTPVNAGTLQAAGSIAKFYPGTALTGMTGALIPLRGSGLGGGSSYNAALLGTAAGFQTQQITVTENIDGSITVPPGGVLALLATTTPVAHSCVPGIVWEEMPMIVTV
jgi:hypothetical protein